LSDREVKRSHSGVVPRVEIRARFYQQSNDFGVTVLEQRSSAAWFPQSWTSLDPLSK
jgi:hypothetical protein